MGICRNFALSSLLVGVIENVPYANGYSALY